MAKNSIADIASAVARKRKLDRKEATEIVTSFFRVIVDGLHEDRIVKVRGLGTFKVMTVKARESINVNTGERLVIDEHDKVTFVPDAAMKELVNKPFSQFATVVVNDGVNFDSVDVAAEAEQQKAMAEQEPEVDERQETPVEQGNETEDVPSDVESVGNVVDTAEPKNQQTEEERSNSIDNVIHSEVGNSDESTAGDNSDAQNSSLVKQEIVESKLVKQEIVEQQIIKNNNDTSNTDEDNVSRDYFDEQMDACKRRCNRNLVLACLLFVIGLAGGIVVGHYVWTGNPVAESHIAIADSSALKSVPKAAKETAGAQSGPVSAQQVPGKDSSSAVSSDATNKAVKADTQKPQSDSLPANLEKINADRRLRYGAYEIVGVEKEVRLKKGQTVASYAKRVLGSEEMVVYFEALNGTDNMKAGDLVKVPKLRLKAQYRK